MSERVFRSAAVIAALILVVGCHVGRTANRHGVLSTTSRISSDTSVTSVAEAPAMENSGSGSAPVTPGDGKVVLIVSFAWTEGPAADIRRSFAYAARQAYPPYVMDAIRCGSAFETALICDSVMQSKDVRLVVFAGDEGAAVAVALLSEKNRVPVLKLTSDTRPFSELSDYVFEFLASGQRQSEVLGRYVVQELRLAQLMMLSSADGRGTTLATGFRSGVEQTGGKIGTTRAYIPETQNIRPDLAEILTDDQRVASGQAPIQAALTPEERAAAFGDPRGGEVLFSGTGDSTAPAPLKGEGLFFAVSPDRIESFISQLTMLPKEVLLLGNSSWMNVEALASQNQITERMRIVVPLLPEVAEKDALITGYESEKGSAINEWELLGLDAGEFVGKLMSGAKGRQDLAKAIPQTPRFTGRAVEVDFGGAHENRVARILRFENGELIPER